MVRHWNRLISMPEHKINKKVFLWDKLHNSPLFFLDIQYIFRNTLRCNINIIRNKLLLKFEGKWSHDILYKLKLRTQINIKHNLRLSQGQRSLIAQLRTGILPLAIEVRRFKNVQEESELCDLIEVESELHILLYFVMI